MAARQPIVPAGHSQAAPGDQVWHEWGGSGRMLHFAHANGFPPGTYRALLERLAEHFHVVSTAARPLWSAAPPHRTESWSELADDLRSELGRRGLGGIVAVGHSLGAATSLLAAAADPRLFAAVVAIDPLLLTGVPSLVWGMAKRLGLGHRLGLVRGARTRRVSWPDRRTTFAAYRRRRIFRLWQPDVLEDYLAAGMVEDPRGGVRLRYPPEWEARIFEVSPHDLWRQLRRIAVPVLLIRGEHSDTLRPAAARRLTRELAASQVVVIPGATHFVPMEQPDEVARVVIGFLRHMTPQGGER